MNIVGIIPARMNAYRLQGKPMKDILGMPMIGHCLKRSELCKDLSAVYVATCDKVIYDYILQIGGKAIMTKDTHQRASDRTAEALLKIEQETQQKIDIVVMIQGDEPMITPEMITLALKPLRQDSDINISNLMADLKTEEAHNDPNEVKVVTDKNQNALYFSREPIPTRKNGSCNIPMKKQVCVIPFRRDFLLEYNQMEPTPLEIIESIDMLRLLENGIKVRMVQTEVETIAVDIPADLEKVKLLMKNDPLFDSYLNSNA